MKRCNCPTCDYLTGLFAIARAIGDDDTAALIASQITMINESTGEVTDAMTVGYRMADQSANEGYTAAWEPETGSEMDFGN